MKKIVRYITNWEQWPFPVLYFPISFIWFWYCLRSRSFWFFSSSNPTITFGGFEGESKKEMYVQLPDDAYPKTMYVLHSSSFSEVKDAVARAGFTYPFVVKPDVGMKGILFRKIENEDQFKLYHQKMTVEYIVQELVSMPIEVSVFYYRHPLQKKGVITGFIQKELLEVTGDGSSTLLQLIINDARAGKRLNEMKRKHVHCLDKVLEKGEVFYLSHAANHNRGARFINLSHLADESLLKWFDELSHYTNQFYYGRYDIKCNSIEELKKGNFSILEFNGAGAEPNHIYDAGISLGKAYKEILKHWKALYQISAYNNANGTPYWNFKKGWLYLKNARQHFKILEQYD